MQSTGFVMIIDDGRKITDQYSEEGKNIIKIKSNFR